MCGAGGLNHSSRLAGIHGTSPVSMLLRRTADDHRVRGLEKIRHGVAIDTRAHEDRKGAAASGDFEFAAIDRFSRGCSGHDRAIRSHEFKRFHVFIE